MNVGKRALLRALAGLVLVAGALAPADAQPPIPIEDRLADVNGVRLHYLVAGKGDPVILLHGYAETSRMWRPLIGELAKTHTVIAPDLRGFDQSSKPDAGYDKKTMAQDVHALAVSLGFHAFPQDAKDFAQFAQVKLTMPMLVLSGEKASGEFLIQQGRLVATDVEGVIVRGSGHWLMEEAPDQVIPKLLAFLNR